MFKKYAVISIVLVAMSMGIMGCGEDMLSGLMTETEKFSSWVNSKLQRKKAETDAEFAGRKAEWLTYYNHKLDADREFQMQMEKMALDAELAKVGQ